MRASRKMCLLGSNLVEYTYTGTSTFSGDPAGDWVLTLKSSGTLTFKRAVDIDVFLVGGGGGGNSGGDTSYGGGGGGGGYTATHNVYANANTGYAVTIGAGGNGGTDAGVGSQGGSTTAFGKTVNGGNYPALTVTNAYAYGNYGGSGGGRGGAGGSNGGNGANYTSTSGKGQGTTTRAFGETSGALYAGGGGAGGGGAGGSGGGGAGGSGAAGSAGTANTGGGGGGGSVVRKSGGKGGSGVVLIRNHRG